MPASSPASQLLKSGTVRAVVGKRPLAKRALSLWGKTLAITVVGAAAGYFVFESQHHMGAYVPPGSTLVIDAPVQTPGVDTAATTHTAAKPDASAGSQASIGSHSTGSSAASANIDALLAATLEKVSQASDPNTIPNLLLAEQQPFLALAARLESFQPHAYFDPGGLNVGYGYCISQRGGENGEVRVRQDLTEAGFASAAIDTLLHGSRKAQESVPVTPIQALRLLAIAGGEYTDAARNTVGPDVFDALPAHRQAALSWLTYNTGASGFAQFRNLIDAVRHDKPLDAVQHITPRFLDHNGTRVVNARAGTALMASYWSKVGLHLAVEHLDTLTASAQKGASPLLAVDPQLKVGRNAKLPESPYLMAPGTVDITSLAARYDAAGARLAIDVSQYGKEPVVASKGFGFDDKAMAIWRAMKAKREGHGETATPSRPRPR